MTGVASRTAIGMLLLAIDDLAERRLEREVGRPDLDLIDAARAHGSSSSGPTAGATAVDLVVAARCRPTAG